MALWLLHGQEFVLALQKYAELAKAVQLEQQPGHPITSFALHRA